MDISGFSLDEFLQYVRKIHQAFAKVPALSVPDADLVRDIHTEAEARPLLRSIASTNNAMVHRAAVLTVSIIKDSSEVTKNERSSERGCPST